jgi:hypothetical protein
VLTAGQVLPHADVLFLAPPAPGVPARDALLALAPLAAPHALLVLPPAAGAGAALLSVPRREYLQASTWRAPVVDRGERDSTFVSVRDESAFFAGLDDVDADDSVVEEEEGEAGEEEVLDAAGARAAFVGGMIWALAQSARGQGAWPLDACLRCVLRRAARAVLC